jgi:hypothetical protein
VGVISGQALAGTHIDSSQIVPLAFLVFDALGIAVTEERSA